MSEGKGTIWFLGFPISFADAVQVISVGVIGVASLLLTTGILIVNVYQIRFNVYTNSFLRAEYLLTGGIFWTLMSLSCLSLHLMAETSRRFLSTLRSGARRRALVHIIAAIGAGLMPFLAVAFLGISFEHPNYRDLSISYGGLMLSGSLYLALLDAFRKRATRNEGIGAVGKAVYEPPFAYVATVVVFTIIVIILYAHATYPEISMAFGGGDRTLVWLVPTKRGADIAQALQLPMSKSGVVGPVIVLTESSSQIVMITERKGIVRPQVITLDRKLIEGTVTNPAR